MTSTLSPARTCARGSNVAQKSVPPSPVSGAPSSSSSTIAAVPVGGVGAGIAFGSFWTPAMSMLTDAAEAHGLDYGYAFALVSLAWAPGQAAGAAAGGAIASVTRDAVPYLGLGVVCLVTLAALYRSRLTASPVAAER